MTIEQIEVVAKCDLCKKPIEFNIRGLAGRILHDKCYDIVLHRLSRFMEIVLLDEKKFQEWLADDGQ